ncbi:hypothetical protein [Candidatus Pantoea persica]|uniref:hypothetical protein n=1 Tax=Candidatus Pantoea persica TaxID=2518128 RepID=UPI00215D7406|nr:hypothetical protein [Candidatus Pantoea persica]MBA2814166.1 Ig-like domain repeat protein [Candidatus Pantoea persica]
MKKCYQVVVDLTDPEVLALAPAVAATLSTSDVLIFDSNTYGTVEAGAIVSLISDVNQNGTWSFAQSVRGTSGTSAANALRIYSADNLTDYTSTCLAEPSTANGAEYNVSGPWYGHFVNSMTFADINRDAIPTLCRR